MCSLSVRGGLGGSFWNSGVGAPKHGHSTFNEVRSTDTVEQRRVMENSEEEGTSVVGGEDAMDAEDMGGSDKLDPMDAGAEDEVDEDDIEDDPDDEDDMGGEDKTDTDVM